MIEIRPLAATHFLKVGDYEVRYRKATMLEVYALRHGQIGWGEFVDLTNVKRPLTADEAATIVDAITSGPEIRELKLVKETQNHEANEVDDPGQEPGS